MRPAYLADDSLDRSTRGRLTRKQAAQLRKEIEADRGHRVRQILLHARGTEEIHEMGGGELIGDKNSSRRTRVRRKNLAGYRSDWGRLGRGAELKAGLAGDV